MEKEKIPKLTRKQKGFVKDYIESGNGTQAALKNYDTDYNTARSIASENLTKPAIVKSINEVLNDSLLNKVHLEGLKATSVRFTPEGEQIQVPDFATRHKYLDTAHKLRGTYAAEKHINVSLEVSPEEREKILGVATGVIAQMTKEEVDGK